MRKYLWLARYAGRQWPALTLILFLTSAASVMVAIQPWPLKLLVDHALGGAPLSGALDSALRGLSLPLTPPFLVAVAAAAAFAVALLAMALDAGLTWAWSSAGQRMVYDLGAGLFHRMQRLSLLFHSKRPVGDCLSRLTGDAYCVYTLTGALLVSPWQHTFTLATIGVVAWTMDAQLAALSFVLAPILAWSVRFFGPRLKRRALEDREARSSLMSLVHQTLGAIPAVQAFGAEDRHNREFGLGAAKVIGAARRGAVLKGAYGLVHGAVPAAGMAVVLYVGGARVLSGALSLGSLLVFIAYLKAMQGAFKGLMDLYSSLKTVEASLDRVREVLEARDEVRDAPGARPVPTRPTGRRGHLRLEEVTFGYEPGRPVLKRVSLEARPGETVALVGPTGAGKSTLISLILRFFDPWEGRVLLDGSDIREFEVKSLRAQTALVLQEPFLLPLTVAENIAFGRPEAGRNEIVAAAVAANADEFIRELPDGYDTVIGERGATLSGGQKQRLSIARALLKDAPVLVLDEPTSALDAGTEASLLESLEGLRRGRTTLIITHRLATVRRADRIAVLEDGSLIDVGTHAELLARPGLYQRMQSLQSLAPTGGAQP